MAESETDHGMQVDSHERAEIVTTTVFISVAISWMKEQLKKKKKKSE